MKLKGFVLLVFILTIQGCKEKLIETSNYTGIWTKVESGVTNALYGIDFINEKNGWIVGDSGVIINTKDGGNSWQVQLCPTEEILWAVDFVDNENGWICSQNSIFKTTDGGENWQIKHNEDLGEGRFRDIKFLNKNIGFVVGGRGSFGTNGILLTTEDGGETWTQNPSNNFNTLTHISIIDENNIWICGFAGTILLSKDVGLTWIKRNSGIIDNPYFTTIQFVDENNGWIASRDDYSGFYQTTNGGSTWNKSIKESLGIFTVQSFYFVDILNGWLSTFPGAGIYAIAQTGDGGFTWKFLPEDINVYDIKSFDFINKNLGWAIGLEVINSNAEGAILQYRVINNY